MSTAQPAGKSPTPAPSKSWMARHKILTFLSVLLIVVLVGFYFLGWPLLRPRFHSQYIAALVEIRQSPEVRERLGEPIEPVRFLPSGDLTDNAAKLTFEVRGPKDEAAVNAYSRLIDGRWGFATLELQFQKGPSIDLAQAIQQREGSDTPKYDPNAKQAEVKAPDLPVDIKLPDMPEMPKK